MVSTPIVIIGSGLAGYTLARELRKLDKNTPLTIITADDGIFYSKPMLSNALAQKKQPSELAMFSAEQMATQLNAAIKTRTRVTAIDVPRSVVQTSDDEVEFGRLILAVGAQQGRVAMNGSAASEMVSVNDLADYTAFRRKIEQAKHVALIGAGLIGCEFANDLVSHGIKVSAIDPGAFPLNRLLQAEAGHQLQTALGKMGVEWHLGTVVERIEHDAGRYSLLLADGRVVVTDAILSAIGLFPNVDLAKQAGLTVQRGIVVDRYLATSAANVYALGDCIEMEGMVLPYVMPLMSQARALAQTLSGTPTELKYPPMPVVVKTPAYPIVVAPSPPNVEVTWQMDVQETGVRVVAHDTQQRLRGFTLSGSAVSEKAALAKELVPLLSLG